MVQNSFEFLDLAASAVPAAANPKPQFEDDDDYNGASKDVKGVNNY